MFSGVSPSCGSASQYRMENDSQKLGLLEGNQNAGCSRPNIGDIYCTLYNTLRLNSLESFIILQRKWLVEYNDESDVMRLIDVILSQVYEELKLKNLEMSPKLQFAIENKIIGLSFITEVNTNDKQARRTALAKVKERIEMTVSLINDLLFNYMNDDKETDQEFLLIARFLCQNIHILKHKLRSTYCQLPWEEMEFVMANFIMMHTNLESNIVYRLVLTRRRLLSHLNCFALQLSKVELDVTDIGSKFADAPRVSLVKAVHANCSYFEALHCDFNQMKDVYSLSRIESYIDMALAVDLEKKRNIGKLVIERTLQVIGECLKNTVGSPHVSDTVHRALFTAAPRNVREIITLLRDSLSHSHTLRKKMELESTADLSFFHEVQNDLKKIKAEINIILCEQQSNIINSFLQHSLQSGNEENFKNMLGSLNEAVLGEVNIGDECPKEIVNIKRLLATLDNLLEDKTETEIRFFEEIDDLLNSHTSRKKEAQFEYMTKLEFLLKIIEKVEGKCDFATVYDKIHSNIEESSSLLEPPLLEKIVSLVDEFSSNYNLNGCYSGTKTKRDIDELLHQIRTSVRFGATRVKGIDSFKHNLEKKNVSTISQTLAESEINVLVQQVDKQLEPEEKSIFQYEFRNSKKKYEAYLELSVLFAGLIDNSVSKDKNTVDRYTALANYLAVKRLNDNLENCNWHKCKDIVDSARSSYQTLHNSVKNAIDNQKFLDIPQLFETFCKSFKNKKLKTKLEETFKVIAQIKKEQHEEYFKKRLAVLEDLLSVSHESRFDFVVNFVKDKTLQAAVEMVVLDVLEALNAVSELPDNIACIDGYSPVLVGRYLRNYLAHGNILVEILPCMAAIGVVASAFKLVEGDALYTNYATKTCQIGHYITENICDLKVRFTQNINVVKNQNAMFLAAAQGDIELVEDTIVKGADIKGRDFRNWTSLHFAVTCDSVDALKKFHVQDLPSNIKDIYGRTPLHIAAIKNSCKAIHFLMEESNLNVNDSDIRSMNPLLYASDNGSQDIVVTLLSRGANIDSKTETGMTPLHLAAGKGHLAIVNLLLKHHANINALNDSHVTPLHLAASHGHTTVVSRLLMETKNVNVCSKIKSTPLHSAARNGHKEVMEVLLKEGAEVNAMAEDGSTPLHIATGEDVVRQLIQHGAQVNIHTTNNYFTPLHCVALCGCVKAVAVLLAEGAWVDGHKRCNWTPLHMAVMKGKKDMVNTLLKFKAAVNPRGMADWTPLHMAAYNGHCSLVAPLLANGADLEARSFSMQTPLHLATLHGRANTVEALVHEGANTYALDEHKMTPLHYAAGFGFADLVKILLTKTDIDVVDDSLDTPLSLAAGQGHKNVVEILLNHGAHVGASVGSKTKWTPLHYAAGNGYTDIVELLCLSNADINAMTNYDLTPLHLAAQNCHKDIVEILLKAGARVDSRTVHLSTPLHYVTNTGHKEIVEVLLSYNADVDAKDEDDMTALHLAAQMGFRDVTEMLLKKGASVDALSSGGETPLHLASTHDHTDVIEVLLNENANINALTVSEWTPLHCAVYLNKKNAVTMLLDKGADPNITTKTVCTPLHFASCNGHTEVVDELLKYNVKIDQPDKVGWTALHHAARKGFDRVVSALLDKGAQLDIGDISDTTPLHYAAKYGHMSIVVSLITKGAEIEAQNRKKNTALHYAADDGQACVIRSLLEKDARVNVKNEGGYTPLDLAAMRGHLDAVIALLEQSVDILSVGDNGTVLHQAARGNNETIMRLLLQRVSSDMERRQFVNATDSDGDTCLVIAVLEGNISIAKLLLDSGVNIDAQSKYDMTALHWAVEKNNLEFVKLLIDFKANKNIAGPCGQTPLDLAKERKHKEIELFLEPQAKIITLFRRFWQIFVSHILPMWSR